MVFISIVSSYISSNHIHSVHPSSLSAGGGGRGWVEPSTKFLKRRSLTVRRELPKMEEVLGQFADLREGAWQKRDGGRGVFEAGGGVISSSHYELGNNF